MKKIPTTRRSFCPVCRNPKLLVLSSPHLKAWKSCSRCGTWIFLPKQAPEAYPSDYYGGSVAKFSGWAQYLRRRFHQGRARWVRKYLNSKKGIVYDVGCGDGLFLQEASGLGLRIMGFEPEETPRRQAEKRLKKPLDRKLFASFKTEKASAITCWQVIEHLREPATFLHACKRHLAEGGLLTLSTVNLDSLQAKCFGGNWLHLDPPRHLWVGSLAKVIRLLEETGFHIVKIRYNCLEFGPVGWVDSLFNLMDTKRDRLLACLKQGCREPRDWVVWFLASALTPVAILLSLVEAALHHPATFEIYARMGRTRARRQGG